MLRSLWHRLLYYWPEPSAGQALARYYRDEGLHDELVLHHLHDGDAAAENARTLYAAHSYFTA